MALHGWLDQFHEGCLPELMRQQARSLHQLRSRPVSWHSWQTPADKHWQSRWGRMQCMRDRPQCSTKPCTQSHMAL